MVDLYREISDDERRRNNAAFHLGRAMNRTRKLIVSPAAARDPKLALKWQERLTRQQENMRGLMRR